MRTALLALILVSLMLVSTAGAQTGLSVQLKRTNPGVANYKPAELIFDIVNTDFDHTVEGFLLCRSPDDATVSSTLGVGAGSGAQYISPKFTLDEGPDQTAISITVDSTTPGDKNTGCIVKYMPVKVTPAVTQEKTVTKEDGTTETVTEVVTPEKKEYRKLNAEYTTSPKDDDWYSIRVDKTVPFVVNMDKPACPEGQASCSAGDVIDLGAAGKIPVLWVVVGLLVLVLLVVYLLGKTSKKE